MSHHDGLQQDAPPQHSEIVAPPVVILFQHDIVAFQLCELLLPFVQKSVQALAITPVQHINAKKVLAVKVKLTADGILQAIRSIPPHMIAISGCERCGSTTSSADSMIG